MAVRRRFKTSKDSGCSHSGPNISCQQEFGAIEANKIVGQGSVILTIYSAHMRLE
jgi:hypothetical protein